MKQLARNLLLAATFLLGLPNAPAQEVSWGQEQEGLRLGLSFEKAESSRDEPIEAEVVLRNLGNTTRHLPRFNNGADAYRLVVFRNGQRLALPPRSFSASGEIPLGPGGALTNRIRLEQRLGSLEPGSYVVSAECSVPPAGKTGLTTLPEQAQVRSGEAAFRLVESTNPSPAPAFSSPTPGRYSDPGSTPQAIDSKARAESHVATPGATSSNGQRPWGGQRKTALGVITVLAVLLLVILWRAARRGRGA